MQETGLYMVINDVQSQSNESSGFLPRNRLVYENDNQSC